MNEMIDLIRSELEEALEVKNSKSLHRGIFLLLASTVSKEEHSVEHDNLKSSINTLNQNVEVLALHMTEGFGRINERFEAIDERFEAIDKRFEAVDKRFEDSSVRFETLERHFDKRFAMMFSFITIGFVMLATMMSVFQFLG